MPVDLDRVTRVVEEAARTLVLPRFTHLSAADVEAKATPGNPTDVVTVVDREVETYLSRALTAVEPSAVVIGEEAVHARPRLLDVVASDRPLWIVDPLDGTKNFAAGDGRFGIMVAFVVEGLTRAAWLMLPVLDRMFVAARGAGAFVNGTRVRVRPTGFDDGPRGAVLGRYMPTSLREAVTAALHGRARKHAPSGCAAIEYTDILEGRGDFAIYYRLLPWDHAAPALILGEAGGIVSHLDGQPYTARSSHQLTVVAGSAEVDARLRAWLRPHVPANT